MSTIRSDHKLAAFVSAIVVAGYGLILWALATASLDDLMGPSAALTVILALLVLAAEARPILFLATHEGLITASWTFSLALLPVTHWSASALILAVSSAVVDLARRRPPSRVLFNSAQVALSMMAASGLHGMIAPNIPDFSSTLSVALWACSILISGVVAVAVNCVLLSVVVALHGHLPVRGVLRDTVNANLSMDGLLIAMAPIFTVVGLQNVVLIPFLLFTTWAIFKSSSLSIQHHLQATHDQLTGLPNRRQFTHQASQAIEVALGSEARLAVLHIDLDGFKGINDRLGHHVGDMTLREVATRIRSAVAPRDLVARLGGDEFAVVLYDIRSPEHALSRADAVAASLSTPLDIEGVPLAVGGSIGVAVFPDHGDDLHTLVDHADIAMYRAKSTGGGALLFRPELDRRISSRLGLLTELPSALLRDELFCHYQPKVDLHTGRVFGVEALVRWRHPRLGLVSPNQFVPGAEQTELMDALTGRVIESALGDLARLHAAGHTISMAINGSARNIANPEFPLQVQLSLARFGIDPHWLEIEVTENTLMDDPERALMVMRQLRDVGVGLALDDFGTGFSSLTHLSDLPVTTVKLHQRFVAGIRDNGTDAEIVRSMIELADRLGLHLITEGVSDVDLARRLVELGGRYAQGYVFAKAMEFTDLVELLDDRDHSLVPHGLAHPYGGTAEGAAA
jgi:diguanylate cyclase (GGDEF)-like protein